MQHQPESGEKRPTRLRSGLWDGSCPECGGGHTCHEGNVLGHAVGCSLKPENIIAALHDENEANFERAERALVPLDALIGDLRHWGGMVNAEAVLKKLADVRAALRERGSDE